jgi:hypothetical protein
MTMSRATTNASIITITERGSLVTQAWLTYPTAALLALCAAGCEVHTHDGYYGGSSDGTLTIDWSLDDSFDADECDHYDGYYTEVIVYEGRDDVAHVQPHCDDFAVSIDLPDGVYSLDATLLDHAEHPVTTSVSLDDIDVYEDRETRISIDFPLDSRL